MQSPDGEGRDFRSGFPPQRETAGDHLGTPETVRVVLLGGFRVSVGSRTVGEGAWRLKKAASFVKLLALAPGHRLPRERMMESLWPGRDPGASANNLYHALHVARRTLELTSGKGPLYLDLRDEWLALCPDGPLWVDVDAFEAAAAIARRTREPAAYRAALDLYAGDLLPEDRYEEWAEGRREALQRLYLTLLVELGGSYEERGEHRQAVEALERAVAAEPAYEEAHVGLMRLHAASGRPFEAILQNEQLQKSLRRRLSREPSAASQRLYREILAGRPSIPRPARKDAPRSGGDAGSGGQLPGRGLDGGAGAARRRGARAAGGGQRVGGARRAHPSAPLRTR